MFRRKAKRGTRARLIEHKHDLEGQIAGLTAELRRAHNRGHDGERIERELNRLRDEHYRTRLRIDQTDPAE